MERVNREARDRAKGGRAGGREAGRERDEPGCVKREGCLAAYDR